jgi:hypothetical protein
MKTVLLVSLFAASVLVTGCETTQTNTTTAERNEGEVITGSRLPRKGGGSDGAVQGSSGEAYKSGQIERQGNGGMRGN